MGLGAYDLFRGETTGANSGEIPLNLLLAALAPAGALGGMAVGAQLMQDEDYLKRKAAEEQQYREDMAKRYDLDKMSEGAKNRAANLEAAGLMERMYRRPMGGALIGAMSGAIPAILAMRDQPAPAQASVVPL